VRTRPLPARQSLCSLRARRLRSDCPYRASVAALGIRIWQRKAYVVQGCGERLQKVKPDFMNYDVEQLVSQASDCVVWMKTTDGKLQHLYAGTRAHTCLCLSAAVVCLPPATPPLSVCLDSPSPPLTHTQITRRRITATSPATRCTYTGRQRRVVCV
jgi:hypothetical protein